MVVQIAMGAQQWKNRDWDREGIKIMASSLGAEELGGRVAFSELIFSAAP